MVRRCLDCQALIARGSRCPGCQRTRQRQKNAEFGGSGWQWQRIRARILARDGGICVMPGCGQPATIVDHIVRREHGGSSEDANLRSLCATCNRLVTYG